VTVKKPGCSVVEQLAMAWMIRVQFSAWTGIFLFITIFLPNLGSIQPPSQWIPMAHSLGAERLENEAEHSPSSCAKAKMCWVVPHSPYTVFSCCGAWT
jgi:hypothetical protein